jgi:hypothetical protein
VVRSVYEGEAGLRNMECGGRGQYVRCKGRKGFMGGWFLVGCQR